MPGSAQIIRRIIVSATCKGGVGRTFFLVNLADWYAEIEQECAFFDSDIYNGTLTRFLPDSRFLPLDNPDEAVRELSEVLDDSEVIGWDALGPLKGYYPDFLDENFCPEQGPLFRASRDDDPHDRRGQGHRLPGG